MFADTSKFKEKSKAKRTDGIKKVSKFVTEDGVEHLTHQEAQKHRSKMIFVEWCDKNNISSVAAIDIYNHWHVTKRKEKTSEETGVGEVSRKT